MSDSQTIDDLIEDVKRARAKRDEYRAEAARLREERDAARAEAARLRDQLLAEQDNAQRRIDELQAEAARLREAIEQHREDVAVFEGSEEDDAWSWHQALWAALDAEDKENQDDIGRREKKG